MHLPAARLGLVASAVAICGALAVVPFAAAADQEVARPALVAIDAPVAPTLNPTSAPSPTAVRAASLTSASAVATAPRSRALRGYTIRATARDASWILAAQRSDGAIATHVDQLHVVPYLSNFAALGLARATQRTDDPRYLEAAWRYLEWYAAHQDSQGFITDYTVTRSGLLRSTGDMDSTDAYAGTYLLAVRAVYAQSGDRERLAALHHSIKGAVAAILATQDEDGLTWAKPTWHVKYLMDQAETLAGLRAATGLAIALEDRQLQLRSRTAAHRLQRGVNSLWNPATGSYDWAKHEDGTRIATKWDRLYPDATQQAWAVAFGAVPQQRASRLMDIFALSQPGWDRPMHLARIDGDVKAAGYWSVVGLAFERTGQFGEAAEGATSIRRTALSRNRAWPFTPSDSGQLIVVGSGSLRDLAP